MQVSRSALMYMLLGSIIFASHSLHVLAKTNSYVAKPEAQGLKPERDGQHDFDFLVGSWKFHLKRLKQRLVGSTEWVEFDGTTVCRKVLAGRGEVEEMNVDNSEKQMHIQGLALRLYNPQSHQWSIYWANAADGVLDPNPMVGQFSNGRGEFYNQQVYEGKAIYARFIWTDTSTNSPHFEQAFSIDGGKTWETNWISLVIRIVVASSLLKELLSAILHFAKCRIPKFTSFSSKIRMSRCRRKSLRTLPD